MLDPCEDAGLGRVSRIWLQSKAEQPAIEGQHAQTALIVVLQPKYPEPYPWICIVRSANQGKIRLRCCEPMISLGQDVPNGYDSIPHKVVNLVSFVGIHW